MNSLTTQKYNNKISFLKIMFHSTLIQIPLETQGSFKQKKYVINLHAISFFLILFHAKKVYIRTRLLLWIFFGDHDTLPL